MADNFKARFLAAAHKFECDKVLVHSYEDAYVRHLARYDSALDVKILEIGVGGESYDPGGASLFMWNEVFPNATIYGLDLYDKTFLESDRIKTFIVDQRDPSALHNFSEAHGPFDIIIDDGSHMRGDVLTSLFNLFGHLKSNGVYVIEDLMTSYWPRYGGSTLARNALDTPVSWIKNVIDVVHRHDMLSVDEKLPAWDVKGLAIYAGIAFIEAGQPRATTNLPNSPDFLANQAHDDSVMYGDVAQVCSNFHFDFFNAFESIKSEKN